MTQKNDLARLEGEIIKNDALPLQESNLVFGEGNSNADVIFIGEAPGHYEDKLQRPFVGRSGKLLDKCIEEISWTRDKIYITNIVKRRPPNNRDPLPEEIEAYKPYLRRQIKIINPKVIVPLGRFAMGYFIKNGKISKDQGKIFWLKDKVVMPIYHPAAALRSTNVLETVRKSFKKLKKVVKDYDKLLKQTRARSHPQTQDSKDKAQEGFI